MADDNLHQRLTTVEARLEGIETELTKLTELVTDNLAESRRTRDDLLAAMRDLRDQMFVQSGILLRLEHRDHDADATTAALQQQIQRLERRLDRLERGG